MLMKRPAMQPHAQCSQRRHGPPRTVFVGIGVGLLAGMFLRVHQLQEQIVTGDEWHGLLAAITTNICSLLAHFGACDYCIPLTVYNHCMLQTIGMSEVTLRLPSVVAGVATVVIFPLPAHREIGSKATVVFCWLLVVSPLHVYYSRFARPYSISLLLGFIAILSMYRWLSGGHRSWAVLFVISSSLTAYCLLVFLPGLLAPVAFGTVWAAMGPAHGCSRSIKKTCTVAGGMLVILAAVLAAPLLHDWQSLQQKACMGSAISARSLLHAYQIAVGSDRLSISIAAGMLCFFGRSCCSRMTTMESGPAGVLPLPAAAPAHHSVTGSCWLGPMR